MKLAIVALAALIIIGGRPAAAEAALLAPAGTCHHATDTVGSHRAKRHALRCLIAYARTHAGRTPLGGSRLLHDAAARKGQDIARCGISHTACGRPAAYWPRSLGYCPTGTWRLGENLASGYASAERVMRAWLASPEHRANLLSTSTTIGTAIRGSTWIVILGACS